MYPETPAAKCWVEAIEPEGKVEEPPLQQTVTDPSTCSRGKLKGYFVRTIRDLTPKLVAERVIGIAPGVLAASPESAGYYTDEGELPLIINLAPNDRTAVQTEL